MNISLDYLAKLIEGTLYNNEDVTIENIVTDSRESLTNNAFICLYGPKFDGHDFALNAYDNGAIVVITERKLDTCKPFILVNNTFDALRILATNYLETFDISKIAVTGSVGKTTTKEMIYTVLNEKYKVHKNKGNFNNHIGVPLTVFNLPKDTEIGIFEMGMNHKGEIDILSSIVKPDISVITNIGTAHIEHLGSKEGILSAKMEIVNHANHNSVLIVNGDDEYLKNVTCDTKLYKVGLSEYNDMYASNILEDFDSISFDLNYNNESITINMKVSGIYNVYAALIGAMCGVLENMTLLEIKCGLEKYRDANNRFEKIYKDNLLIINDSYNASLDSIKASIKRYSLLPKSKILCLGDVLEVGNFSKEIHTQIGEIVNDSNADLVIYVGKDIKYAYDVTNINKVYYETNNDLIKDINKYTNEYDSILFKASNSCRLGEIIEHIN